jgi:hypothetical protein
MCRCAADHPPAHSVWPLGGNLRQRRMYRQVPGRGFLSHRLFFTKKLELSVSLRHCKYPILCLSWMRNSFKKCYYGLTFLKPLPLLDEETKNRIRCQLILSILCYKGENNANFLYNIFRFVMGKETVETDLTSQDAVSTVKNNPVALSWYF